MKLNLVITKTRHNRRDLPPSPYEETRRIKRNEIVETRRQTEPRKQLKQEIVSMPRNILSLYLH